MLGVEVLQIFQKSHEQRLSEKIMLGVEYLLDNFNQEHLFPQEQQLIIREYCSLWTRILLVKAMNIASTVDAIFIVCSECLKLCELSKKRYS